jgi:2-oxoglutarate dehydrogenase E1 component
VEFGANEWLVEEMRDLYDADPASVGEAWRALFEEQTPTAPRRCPADAEDSATG